jgi:GntR family transcriptional regulator
MAGRSGRAGELRETLRTRILDGSLPGGMQLPAEIELARSMGVSRTSLREAVLQLEHEGLVIRRHGFGTFVRSTNGLGSSLGFNLSVSDLIRSYGMEPGTLDPLVERRNATAYEAGRLGLGDGEQVVVLERVRTADGRPVVFIRDVLPSWLLADHDLHELQDQDLSLYRYLSDRLGVTVVDAVATLRPMTADADLAARLRIKVASPVLVIEQVDHDETERRLLLTWEHHVADAFEFVIRRQGPTLRIAAPGDGSFEGRR